MTTSQSLQNCKAIESEWAAHLEAGCMDPECTICYAYEARLNTARTAK